MKKIILQPKAIMLTYLVFGILAILVPVVYALASGSTNGGYSWQLSSYDKTYSGQFNLLRIGVNGDYCYQNNDPVKNYFIPFKITDEFVAFDSAVTQGTVPNVSRTTCCDSAPTNIYYNAGYYTDHLCGQSFPGCYLSNNYGYNVANQGDTGSICLSGNWRSTRCGTLFKATSVCNGDPCVNGIDYSSANNPQFCVGVYDSLSKICVYQSKVPVSVSNNTPFYYPANTPYYNNTAGSWGSCVTQPICGNGLCESQYGEDCSTCSTDCGVCPADCSLYNKMTTCNAVSGCYWDQASYTCGSGGGGAI